MCVCVQHICTHGLIKEGHVPNLVCVGRTCVFLSTCSGVFGDRQATSLSGCCLFVCDNVNMSVFAICLGTGVYQNMGDGVCVCA